MKKPLQPIDAFEADLWGLWDMLKRALDDQEWRRTEGAKNFLDWIDAKAEKWNFYAGIDALVEACEPARYHLAYGAWLASRDIREWTPPAGGPFWWRAPGMNFAEMEKELESRREAYEAFKAKLRQQQKDYLKKYKAEQRAKDRAAKKAAKEKADGRSVPSDSAVNEL